jgi:formylglycine-generating enzyme required for sulfatase activity
MTQSALDSFWVQLELQAYLGLMARDRTRILLPVRIGPCTVPPFLNALFWIDAQAISFEQAIYAIATALTIQEVSSIQPPVVALSPPRETLPPLGPAPAPANSVAALQLTPTTLYNLGFRGYSVNGVECILPPVCLVPAGVFTMGGDRARDKWATDREMPQCPVEVDSFGIGQHPVTVAEYACAVRAHAVREPPQYYEYSGTKYGPDWAAQQSHPDQPVVCVSWYDALAYSRWLATVTGQPWRLPTEAEWEKAARGTDGRIYPWGDAFDAARCNTVESGIGTMTAVGSYPAGESPYHVQDMSGNVSQWTSSLFMPYPYSKNDGRENFNSTGDRVVRGTSWKVFAESARLSIRPSDRPDYLNASIGFRLLHAAGS